MRGFEFRASGRQPIELGWRAAFPDWQPADEKGDEAQLLPPLRNGETAELRDPKSRRRRPGHRRDTTKAPLIEAMQNAWRFVDDEVLRERLKDAKGIGTPATRAEIIGGLKKQGLVIAQGNHIAPTEAGLSLFGVLRQAVPALVDPGVTAQLECLLDDVVIGKQEMVGAIDAVCSVAERIIGKLKEGGAAGGPPLSVPRSATATGRFPPTPAMKRFADSVARQKGIKPPPGYKTSISICRKFLNEHAPKKAEGETPGKFDSNRKPGETSYAKKIAQGEGLIIPDEAKANSAAMSVWIDFEPRRETPQARSQNRPRASGIGCASIDSDDEEASPNPKLTLLPLHRLPRSQIRLQVRPADSLWQQARRDEAWSPLWLGRMVCAAGSRSFCIRASEDGCRRLAARRSAHEWAHKLHHQRTDHARPPGRAALAWRLRAEEHGGRRERGAMPLSIAR